LPEPLSPQEQLPGEQVYPSSDPFLIRVEMKVPDDRSA
jgi:hypothetical protein